MSNTEDEELILKAIDELRRRKARPDFDRICKFLHCRFNVERSHTVAILNRVVLCNPAKVIKVTYKGSTSYRRPSTQQVKPGTKYQQEFTQLLSSALSELIVREPDYLDTGVPPDEFEKFVYEKEKPLYNKKSVQLIILSEIRKGTFVRLETGNLCRPMVDGNCSPSAIGLSLEETSPNENTSTLLYDSPAGIGVGTMEIESPEASSTLLCDEKMYEDIESDDEDVTMKGKEEEDLKMYEHVKSDDEDVIMKVKEEEDLKMYEHVKSDDEDVTMKGKEEENLENNYEKMYKHIESDNEDLIMKVKEEENLKIEKVKGKRGQKKKILSSEDTAAAKDSIINKMVMETAGFRDGARRKRAAKKVFDPSDNQLPSKRRGRPLGIKNKEVNAPAAPQVAAAPNDRDKVEQLLSRMCCVCHKKKSATNEKLLTCRDCSNKAHPSCSQRKGEGKEDAWQCAHCKTCTVCNETDEYASMVMCYVCDNAYHFSCHTPQIPYKIRHTFVCHKCAAGCLNPELIVARKSKPPSVHHSPSVSDSGASSQVTTPSSSPLTEFPLPLSSPASDATLALITTHSSSSVSSGQPSGGASTEEFIDYTIPDESIPDATGWSVTQVSKYLNEEGYPEQARVFEMNEIDGTALLLLKRSDIVSGDMFEKLGPALKAYKQVRKLQIRRSENFLFWAT